MTLKKNRLLLLLLTLFTTTLYANSLYIKVASVTKSDALFALQYELQSIGYESYITEYNQWYRVYTGPFENKHEANAALKKIRSEISKDAYLTKIEVQNNKIVSTPVVTETKQELASNVKKEPVVVTSSVTTVTTQNPTQKTINQETFNQYTVQNSQKYEQSSVRELKKNYFVGVSLGAAKFDIKRSGNLPLDILMRSYGPSYGCELGYYFAENIFMTLNYQRTDLRHSYFDSGFATLNYQLDKIGTLSPYFGLLVGTSQLNWKNTPVNGATAPSTLYSYLGGAQLGGDIELFGGLSTYMYYRYMMMDFSTLVSEGTLSSDIEHNSQQDFNLGLKYSF